MFSKKPFIIAGPCGAESEEQLQQIGLAFQNSKVDMVRAGVWKPRTKPGSFEGCGEDALKWLQAIKKEFNLKVCTEVAGKEQVELCLKYEMDALWIGARSTVSPFIVQEITDAIKGNNVAVMIKNPINPDVELWSGGIERLLKADIKNIACIHRGFSSYDESSIYRNKPNWAIPIEIKRRFPNIPIYCDISHISGKRALLQDVAQRAMDLDFDGLMIESHPSPTEAKSDAEQQIQPEKVFELLANLIIREKTTTDTVQEKISHLREIMDTVDAEIIDLIAKRQLIGENLGHLKVAANLPIYQPERWREIVESRSARGKKNQLSEKFIHKIFELIHEDSIKRQIEIAKKINFKIN